MPGFFFWYVKSFLSFSSPFKNLLSHLGELADLDVEVHPFIFVGLLDPGP